ncbi:hypothetical protein VTN77DRAFT_7186 [Rasamsonia byssochlamydoides]|uniref:uncharacterized protein n=1 Tax=Rasamsonia byssochlamydoides TaxID=89139 RepID=UPI003743BE72
MVNSTAAVLEPTYTGYVATTHDALILFEACLTGVLHHVPRRPHDRERSHLVRSGSVFIYEENSSGIKRWTDGVTWSPSRILGNFLVYRELDKPFPPGEKKRAMKKGSRRPGQSTRPGEPYPRPDSNGQSYSPTTNSSGPFGDRTPQSEVERALVGSLVDSYGFKDSGLVKKTMSVTVSGVTHHLVSYYSVEDVLKGVLSPPSMVESLRYIRPRAELTSKQSFRAPIDDLDTGLDNPNDPTQALYGYRHALIAPPSYGLPSPHPDYYMHSSPYGTHPSQPGPMSGYPGAPLQSASTAYLPAPPGSSQMPVKADAENSPFRYGTGFESLNQNHIPTTIPPTLNTTAVPNSLNDRNRSQQTSSPTIYRNLSLSSRTLPNDTTDGSTSAATYSRGSFSISGALDNSSNQSASTPFDPTVSRRDSNPIPPSYYGGSDRQNYYVGAAAAHSNYPTAQPISAWTTTAPAQPQM